MIVVRKAALQRRMHQFFCSLRCPLAQSSWLMRRHRSSLLLRLLRYRRYTTQRRPRAAAAQVQTSLNVTDLLAHGQETLAKHTVRATAGKKHPAHHHAMTRVTACGLVMLRGLALRTWNVWNSAAMIQQCTFKQEAAALLLSSAPNSSQCSVSRRQRASGSLVAVTQTVGMEKPVAQAAGDMIR